MLRTVVCCCFVLVQMDSQCQPLLLTVRDTAALVSVDPSIVDHWTIDEERSNHSRGFGRGQPASPRCSIHQKPSASSRSACCRLCPAVMDGLLKRLSVSVRCLFCKSVFGKCALGLRRKEHLLSPLTSRVVCLPLRVPDVEHLGNIFQPHFEVGGGSRFHVLLAEECPHRLRRAHHLLAHLFFTRNDDEARRRTSHVHTQKRSRAACATKDARRTARRTPAARGPGADGLTSE